jgi:hypothetical protein
MSHDQIVREYAYALYEWRTAHHIPGDEIADWLQSEKAIGPPVPVYPPARSTPVDDHPMPPAPDLPDKHLEYRDKLAEPSADLRWEHSQSNEASPD